MSSKPVILALDDDTSVLSAVARDLRKRYGEHYKIVRSDSGSAALETLNELKRRNDPVALFLVDQRMPQMSGVEFLKQARALYPETRRALLTAYADTDAAIEAINSAAVHQYLLKPWDPPEDKLFPVLDDMLDDWSADYQPPFEGLRIIGHRWSPETHQLKDFLARNHVPYQYFDLETDPQSRVMVEEMKLNTETIPLVIDDDGKVLTAPTTEDLAQHIGLQTQAEQKFYDLAIVGAGPAGLAAAVYGASEGLRTVMIEREAPGGQAGTSSKIENYLGFPSGVSGADLARRAVTQAKRFGVEILAPQEVTGMRVEGPYRILTLKDGGEISCHALVVAVGLSYKTLDVPGMDQLHGAGVYYGASVVEASACQDMNVVVVGAGNSAGQAAMHLSTYASRVVMLVRGDSLGAKMSQYLVSRIEATPNIEVWLESEVSAVRGQDHLERVCIRHCNTGEEVDMETNALFVFIGAVPHTEWLPDSVLRDKYGFILTGPDVAENSGRKSGWPLQRAPYLLETSVPGVFVVGDVRSSSVKRVASAVGEGSIAVQFVHQYLSKVR